MKRIFTLLTFVIFGTTVFAQASLSEKRLKRSAAFNRAGWILAGAGTACTIGGIILINKGSNLPADGNYTDQKTLDVFFGLGLAAIGVSAVGTSIPFFVRSHKLYKKAISLNLKNERTNLLTQGRIIHTQIPALALQIKF